ncbi:MAG: tRNA (N(6)-L-threonylcarbamoyladenosine(37)-C(2))-methylthiotransferase [Candidatus Altiarchaeota archaeon]|nr:tRNA (N(6)-L-threonylcarbamoyladenosine(37)-C(2))-methylthiotransferase [Candidatus Altiarchaeota archaeon]
MRVEVRTYGCALNQADGEIISGLLVKHGFSVGKDGKVVVVNTCTVKAPTENKIVKELRGLSKLGKRIVVAGCIPSARPGIVDEFPKFSFIGVNSVDVVAAVEAARDGERYVNISDAKGKENVPKVRMNPFVAIVPIAEGCVGSCSYCQVRFARGSLKSYSARSVVEQVESAVNEGVEEVWLTAQDTGAYGLDIGLTLPELISTVSSIPLDFRIRVGMMNPNHVLGFLDELLESYDSDKVYKFAHLPVQSGDDKVLKDMDRKYSVREFKEVVGKFKRRFNATVSTDSIVGYPTESEQAFQNTLKLIDEVKPDVLNISRYWVRPGTKASELKQLPGSETNRRSRITAELFKKIGLAANKRWVGWSGEALVSEKNKDGSYTARNNWYKPIIVKSKKDLMGKKIKVEIKDCTYYDLRGLMI